MLIREHPAACTEQLRLLQSEGGRMAQRGISLDEDMLRCAICLDLLKDPVTIPCGHNYCSECIKNHWKGQEQKAIYSCPQCREVFIPRPVVGKNTMLAELVEEIKKVTLQDAPHLHRYVGPGDVSCDFCTGRKMKATKSCLQCLASYCDLHLQPHYDSPAFKTHKLVTASADIQENICSLHNKMKEIFCRSDQQTICFLCSMKKHKGHDTVSAAAERTEWQQELGPRRQDIWQRVQDREEALKLLQKEGDAITNSARDTVENIQAMFNQLLQPLAQRSCDVQQLIGSQQEAEMRRVEELQQRVQQEISELTRRDHELEKLSHTEDHIQFLRRYPSLISLGPSTNSDINIQSPNYFNQIAYAVTELIQKLQDTLRQEWTRITMTTANLPQAPAHHGIPPSPQAILSKVGSLELPPEIHPKPERPKDSAPAALPPLAKSKIAPIPPRRLKSFDDKVLIPSAYSNIIPTAQFHTSSRDPKILKPTYPTPGGHLQKGPKVSSPMYPTLDKSTVLSPAVYPTSSIAPSAPIYISSSESKTSQAAAVPALTESKVSPPRGSPQNHSKVSSPTYPTPDQSKGSSSDLTKGENTFTPPLGYPSLDKFKVLPPAAPNHTPGEPKTRTEFLPYACRLILDPNTAHKMLVLSGQNMRVTRGKKKQSYPNHPERFTDRFQVLSREGLTGRCYWEVEWSGIVSVAVAFKHIIRAGETSGFGDNKMSWALYCHNNKYIHDGRSLDLPGPPCSRIGVYLDHEAGVLSFYSISSTMTLLHRVQAAFTQPLHAGICVGSGSAELLLLL
ncbi:PREDICTED: E3 ubiquitin/ISG15 ligase TRIM25-like [Poecilia mexicana]|uniref:RING-type E3 ubiquitin transferase n=1 Tax=Poecilia mexicana TaxID=48701 RepID=A0A3B3X9H5_9TELE|nr:PREDICTED: E3 ubiquitin/ISG15 ligase TRIM25-like [Poecilia mexicana]